MYLKVTVKTKILPRVSCLYFYLPYVIQVSNQLLYSVKEGHIVYIFQKHRHLEGNATKQS